MAVLVAAALGLTVVVAAPSVADATPGVTPVGDSAIAAELLATSMTAQTGLVTDAFWHTPPTTGDAHAIVTTPLGRFPRNQDRFVALTSGSVANIDDPGHFSSSANGGSTPEGRGEQVFDVSVLGLALAVPSTHNCLRFDFAFLSEEYPDYVGSQYNDGFIAELGETTWTTSGSEIIAPNNFAHPLDAPDEVVSVNSIGVGWSLAEAASLSYSGATVPLTASTPIEPGGHLLYLSIFDQGDAVFDSAAFIEGLRTTTVLDQEQCRAGAAPAIERPLVLLPGIMGSYLSEDGGTGTRVWPSTRSVISRTALDSDGITNANDLGVAVDRGRGANGMIGRAYGVSDVYATTVSYFEDRGYVVGETLFPYGTDWRLEPAVNAERLWTYLEDEGVFDTYDMVDMVAHSQGGLVAHDAIAATSVAGRPGTERVEHLATIGTPWLGAAELASFLLHGQPCKGAEMLGVCQYRRRAASDAIRHMPGALQLLPAANYPSNNGEVGAINGLTRAEERTRFRSRIGAPGAPLLDAASTATSARFDDRAFEAVETLHVVGSGHPTTYRIEEVPYDPCSWWQRGCTEPAFDEDSEVLDSSGIRFLEYDSGDGTVTESSARMGVIGSASLPSVTRAYVNADRFGNRSKHTPMMRSDVVLEYVWQFISDTLPGVATATQFQAAVADEADTERKAAMEQRPDTSATFSTASTTDDPAPTLSDEPDVLEGIALDLLGVGTLEIDDGRGETLTVDVRLPYEDDLDLDEDDPGLLDLLEALEGLHGVSVWVMPGRVALFVTPGAGTEPVTVRFNPELDQEIGMLARSYENGVLARSRVLPQTVVGAGELIRIDLARSTTLPTTADVAERSVAFGPQSAGPSLPASPTSTVTVDRTSTGLAVTADATIDSGTVERVEWRSDPEAPWTSVPGASTTLELPSDTEHLWVRAVSTAAVTEAPAQYVRVAQETIPTPQPGPVPDPISELPADPKTNDACPDGMVPDHGYVDVTAYQHAIDCLAWWRIAEGTGTNDRNQLMYSPARPVTRAQMASYISNLILRSGRTLPTPQAAFDDVPGESTHASGIGQLAAARIVVGYTDGTYRPDEPVTRAQMATFLTNAFEYRTGERLPTNTAQFPDVTGGAHRGNIGQMADRGWARGYGDGSYRPDLAVRRDHMALFITRILDDLVADHDATRQ